MAGRTWKQDKTASVAAALKWYGGLGFWVQLIFLIIVLLLGLYTFTFDSSGGNRATFANFLSFLVLALPIFTTFWCRRYVRLGQGLANSAAPAPDALSRQIWIGIWAGFAGAVVSLLSLFGAASTLLVTMLANPQIGIQVAPGPDTPATYTISAIDAVSIMSLLLTLTAELVVVFLSLRLFFLATAASDTSRPG